METHTKPANDRIGWRFDNSYARLPKSFYAQLLPVPVRAPRVAVSNHVLAESLGLDLRALSEEDAAQLFAGYILPDSAHPIAQAYAGHQFGNFTMLGDGRAILLGEHLTQTGERFDIQLKGSGQTPFSRRGDGRVALAPLLREYIISVFPVVQHGLCAILLIACLCNQALAQTDEGVPDGLEIEIERTVESASEEESSAPDFLVELEHYRHNPINLYTTTADILTRLLGITLPDAVAILTAVDSLNPVEFEQFEEELPALLSAQQWLMLRTYTTLARPMSELDHPGLPLQVDIRSSWFRDLQPRRGYGDDLFRRVTRRDPATGDSLAVDTISLGPSYLGPRDALLTRLNLKYGDNELNLTFEKDAGEPFMFSDTVARSYANYELVDPAQPAGSVEQKLGTFISGSGAATVGPVRLIVGAFTAEYGQGLALWSSFGGAKNGAVIDAPFKAGRLIARSPRADCGWFLARKPSPEGFLLSGAFTPPGRWRLAPATCANIHP